MDLLKLPVHSVIVRQFKRWPPWLLLPKQLCSPSTPQQACVPACSPRGAVFGEGCGQAARRESGRRDGGDGANTGAGEWPGTVARGGNETSCEIEDDQHEGGILKYY